MIVNTEWGSLDNELFVLPNTPFNKAVSAESFRTSGYGQTTFLLLFFVFSE